MIFAILKKLQLFGFAFAFSASALVVTAVSAGHFERSDIAAAASGVGIDYFENNPEMLESVLSYVPLASAEPEPTQFSLAALKQRIGFKN